MKYDLMPTMSIYALRDAIQAKYPNDKNFNELNTLLWPEDFMNDSYKSLWFRESGTVRKDEIYDFYDEEEDKIASKNLLYSFLAENLPDFDAILLDVSW